MKTKSGKKKVKSFDAYALFHSDGDLVFYEGMPCLYQRKGKAKDEVDIFTDEYVSKVRVTVE
jgi:hypothetical protein